MGTPVDANGRSILHKGHGMTHASAVPDVCKTPSPGGPVPIPYPNLAMDSNLVDGASSVQIEGNPVANVKSKIATSSGDEPGSVGGVTSNVFKGTCTWKMGSPDVKAEGESVVRFLDTTFHNGNAFNTSFIDQGGTGMGYANDFDGLCPICNYGPDEHAIPSMIASSARICADLIAQLRARPSSEVARKRGKKYTGYMVGVMVCKCAIKRSPTTPNTFATMSGTTEQGFTDVAGQIEDIHRVLPGGAASVGDMVAANTSGAGVAAKKIGAIVAAALDVESARERGRPGYSAYGSCAGAKLLARSGHAPIAMTEMFYQPPDREPWRSPPYHYRVNRIYIGTREYTSNDPSVGSCNTCQETLYLTMCPIRRCK